MPSLLSIQLYHLLVILAHILLTVGQFIPHPQTPVEVCQKLPTLTIIGVAHQYLVKYQTPMLFLPWIFIITVESTIPLLHFLQPTIILVALTRVQFHLLLKDLLGRAQIYQDEDLLCTHSLLVTASKHKPNKTRCVAADELELVQEMLKYLLMRTDRKDKLPAPYLFILFYFIILL
ncbi:hypothetical protein PRUPE_7G062400 [Prunus persica]|uniref:Uncharacterized protein n=1 Tax=Prunus persica TaxID=3760 RepID=A0A251NAM6_PRUPE|nr:hypothetical protein PRUPE_7G062400 [Prunus persica]